MNEPGLSFRLGDAHPIQVIVLEPLFEEANRCRRLIATMMRALDKRGIGSVLAVLPGTAESLTDIQNIRLADWRESLVGTKAGATAALRGGALVDDAIAAQCHWRFAPETGSRIVRDLKRTALTGSKNANYAGHALSDGFLTDLEAASPAPLSNMRTLRLESDAADADQLVPGSPLWRRAEPGDDPELASLLADDLANWISQCAAF